MGKTSSIFSVLFTGEVEISVIRQKEVVEKCEDLDWMFAFCFDRVGLLHRHRKRLAGQPFMLATAGTGGTYYVIGGAMSDVMRRFDNTKVTSLTTNGSIENLRLVAGKRAAIGFSTPDLVYYAYNGLEMFKERKLQNLRYIGGGHMGAMQLVVPKNSPVKKIADLKGKRVAVGAQGSAVYTLALDVLGVGGLTASDITPAYLSMTEMTEALQDNTVDAAIYSAGVPTSSITNIFATKEMRIVPYSHKEVQAYLAKSGPEKKALLVTLYGSGKYL